MPISLITAEEMNALPEDDDIAAFVGFERICRDTMNNILARYGQNDDDSQVHFAYMIEVRAAALAYEVLEVLAAPDPSYEREAFTAFYTVTVAVATRLALQGRRDRSAQSVALAQGAKARLRKHASDLEEALDASDLPEARKKVLKAKLAEFNAELDRERSNMAKMLTALALVTAALTPAAMLVGTVEDDVIKLPKTVNAVQQITAILGKAKAHEIENAPTPVKLPKPEPTRALAAPEAKGGYSTVAREDFSADLDDEIPF